MEIRLSEGRSALWIFLGLWGLYLLGCQAQAVRGGGSLSTGGLTTSHINIFQIYRGIPKKSNSKRRSEFPLLAFSFQLPERTDLGHSAGG